MTYPNILAILKEKNGSQLKLWKQKPKPGLSDRFSGNVSDFSNSIIDYIRSEFIKEPNKFLARISGRKGFTKQYGFDLEPIFVYGEKEQHIARNYHKLITRLWEMSYHSPLNMCDFGIYFEYCKKLVFATQLDTCLLYTSPSPRD